MGMPQWLGGGLRHGKPERREKGEEENKPGWSPGRYNACRFAGRRLCQADGNVRD